MLTKFHLLLLSLSKRTHTHKHTPRLYYLMVLCFSMHSSSFTHTQFCFLSTYFLISILLVLSPVVLLNTRLYILSRFRCYSFSELLCFFIFINDNSSLYNIKVVLELGRVDCLYLYRLFGIQS